MEEWRAYEVLNESKNEETVGDLKKHFVEAVNSVHFMVCTLENRKLDWHVWKWRKIIHLTC